MRCFIKKFYFVIILCAGFLIIFNFFASAEARNKDGLLDEVVKMVNTESVDFTEITERVKNKEIFDIKKAMEKIASGLFSEFRKNRAFFVKLLVISIISGILLNLNIGGQTNGASNVSFYVCYSLIATLCVNSFYETISLCASLIDELKIFMQSLLPVLAMAQASSGNTASAGTGGVMFYAMQIITHISQSIFLPLIFTITALCIVNNLSQKFHITNIIELLRQILKWSLGVITTLLVGIISAQGVTNAFFDRLAGKTVKYALQSFVPVVGGVLADSASSVFVSFGIIKNTIGISSVVAVFIICLPTLFKLASAGIIYKLASAVAEPVCDKRIVSLLSDASKSVTLCFAILMLVCLIFIISVAILCLISGAQGV